MNNRYINLIHLRETPHRSTPLHRDIEKWYCRKSLEFEDEYRRLVSGCRCKISSPSGNQDCYLLCNRDTLSLCWCYIYPENDEEKTSNVKSYKRSELKSIPLKDIQDVQLGVYKDRDESLELPAGSNILSIRFVRFTLEFVYPPESNRAILLLFERWIEALISVIHFLAIPVR